MQNIYIWQPFESACIMQHIAIAWNTNDSQYYVKLTCYNVVQKQHLKTAT